MLTFEQIKELIELVAQRKLQGLEVERSGFRLKIDGQASAASPAAVQPAPASEAPAVAAASPVQTTPRPASAPESPEPEADEAEGGLPDGAHVVKSPIVGTFYRASAPDADPFVEVGDRVKDGQILCIVEAMKLMNEIESEIAGTILEIYPDNAQPVEFGEPLFAIQPS